MSASMMIKEKIKVKSISSNLQEIRAFVTNLANKAGFSVDDVEKIELAVDEACSNVVRHAYEGENNFTFEIDVLFNNGKFKVTVTDKGRGFDPAMVNKPDLNEYLDKFKVGGLGIHLMNELMDQVEYTIDPGKENKVTLIKILK